MYVCMYDDDDDVDGWVSQSENENFRCEFLLPLVLAFVVRGGVFLVVSMNILSFSYILRSYHISLHSETARKGGGA